MMAGDWRPRLRAAGLVLPLLAFIGVTFVAPLATMLSRSVYDAVVADALPETLARLEGWDGDGLPGEEVFVVAARELMRAQEDRVIGRVAGRVNRVQGGLRSVIAVTGRRMPSTPEGSWRATMTAINPAWGEARTWHAVRTAGQRFTTRHYLAALDLQRLPDGSVVRQDEDRRIYLRLFARTFMVSLTITGLCLLFGYPLAHFIANAPPRRAGLLLALVLVPFWTSLLVRTTSWIVLLQGQGVINDILVALGLVSDGGRLALVYNMTGTFVAMTHVLLPFMVLPLYSVMRGIPRSHMNAATSLGAGPAQGFLRVYWPADAARSGGGEPARIHPGNRLLHHPRAGRGQHGPADFQHGRVPHADVAQLGAGVGAGGDHPGMCDRPLPAIRAGGGDRTRERRLGCGRSAGGSGPAEPSTSHSAPRFCSS